MSVVILRWMTKGMSGPLDVHAAQPIQPTVRWNGVQHSGALAVFSLVLSSVLLCARIATPTTGTTATPSPSQPFTLVKTEDYLLDVTINEHWLAWAEWHSGQPMFGVYDLLRGTRHPVSNPQGGIALLDGDNLYILRQKLGPLRSSFYALDLNSGQERLLREDVFATKMNGRMAVWLEAYPDVCTSYLDRMEEYYTGCSARLMTLDLATGETRTAGYFNHSIGILTVTPELVMLKAGWEGIKAYSTPIEVVDLASNEYRVLSTISYSPGPSVRLVGVAGRTVAYSRDGPPGEVVVLHIEPFQQAKVLAYLKGIRARALAGPEILVYSDWRNTSPPLILFAVNMRNGDYQEIRIDDDVKQFVASATHLAWVNRKEQLFVTPLELKLSSMAFPLTTPGPTLPSQLLSPQPLPIWNTPPPRPATVTPGRPGVQSYPSP